VILFLPEEKQQEIFAHAEKGYPREVCGIVLGISQQEKRMVHAVLPAHNINTKRAKDRYTLDPKDFQRADAWARKENLEILGFYHSHPDSLPRASKTDRDEAWEGYCYLIISVYKGKAHEFLCWEVREGEVKEISVEVHHGPCENTNSLAAVHSRKR